MSSIGSTINSINSSLLSEIRSFNAQKSPTTSSAAQTTSAVTSDAVDFSQVGQLFKSLRQLETSNPTEFKQVMSDAASQLRSAAAASDTQQADVLNSFAEKFESASSSGNLAAFQPGSNSAGAQGLYTPTAHHHHHGGVEKTDLTSQDEIKSVAATSSSS
jgi:hypothetical protein